jgi:hypothetical protein
MGYTISLDQIIDYSPEKMRGFFAYGYEYIDNRQFALSPVTVLGTEEAAAPYVAEAKRLFLDQGWRGDGDVELLWIPPFAFPLSLGIAPVGVVIWHVKQEEDGISYLLSPIALPFEEFAYSTSS